MAMVRAFIPARKPGPSARPSPRAHSIKRGGVWERDYLVCMNALQQVKTLLFLTFSRVATGDSSTSAQKLNIPTRYSVFSSVSPHSSMFTSVSDCVINVNVTSSSASE